MTALTPSLARELVQSQGTNIIIPSGYTSISEDAFRQLDINSAWISDGVTEIGNEAFRGTSLASIQLPDGLKFIRGGAFSGTNLVSLEIPESVESIYSSAFYQNDLQSITLPRIDADEDNTFYNNNIVDIDLPSGLTYIGHHALSYNQLKNISIPESVTHVHSTAFNGNPLEEVSISKYYDYTSWVPNGVDIVRRDNVIPSDILISLDSIDEGVPDGSPVAFLDTIDEYGDSHTYSLTSGEGDSDNHLFRINDNLLFLNSSPDFESKSSYSIRLQTD